MSTGKSKDCRCIEVNKRESGIAEIPWILSRRTSAYHMISHFLTGTGGDGRKRYENMGEIPESVERRRSRVT